MNPLVWLGLAVAMVLAAAALADWSDRRRGRSRRIGSRRELRRQDQLNRERAQRDAEGRLGP